MSMYNSGSATGSATRASNPGYQTRLEQTVDHPFGTGRYEADPVSNRWPRRRLRPSSTAPSSMPRRAFSLDPAPGVNEHRKCQGPRDAGRAESGARQSAPPSPWPSVSRTAKRRFSLPATGRFALIPGGARSGFFGGRPQALAQARWWSSARSTPCPVNGQERGRAPSWALDVVA